MTLEEYFGDWMKIINKRELNAVMSRLEGIYRTKPVCPLKSDVFKAFRLTPYNNLKIIMLGKDPYPDKYNGKPRATGILFGNDSSIEEENISPSLKIIKEAAINLEVPHNSIIFDNTMKEWAEQGILMINSALTVEMNKIGSHVMIWRNFIASLLSRISEYNTGIIYILYGRQAQTFTPYINAKMNYIFNIEHPAYYARINKRMPSELFDNVNKIVKEMYKVPIKWYKEY